MNSDSRRLNEKLNKINSKTMKVINIQENLERVTVFNKFLLSQSNKGISLQKEFSDLSKLQARVDSLSQQLKKQGIIRNEEAVSRVMMNPGLILPNLDILTKIRFSDAMISYQKYIENIAKMQEKTSIPHMPLYANILEAVDETVYNKIQSVAEEYTPDISEEDIDIDESEINIVRPYFFDAAVKINMYITITNDHIEHNGNIDEEDKKTWKKFIVPVLMFLQQVFMTWAMSGTPITEMNIVEQLEKIVQIVEDYQYPIEITDPNPEGDESFGE